MNKQKLIRGWVIVTKRGSPFSFSFSRTQYGAQVNYRSAIRAPNAPMSDWLYYKALGLRAVRATLVVDAPKEGK